MNNYIGLEGQLGTPLADSQAISERLSHCLQGIASLNPLFTNWVPHDTRRHRSALPATLSWPPQQAELCALVNEGAIFESRKGRKAHVGYDVNLWTPKNDPIQANFWLRVDFTDGAWWFLNRTGITFFVPRGGNIWVELQRSGQNPIAFSRQALINLGTTWDCDWAAVYQGDFRWGGGPRPANVPLPRYRSGWMVYLDQTRADLVSDIQDIHVYRLPSGGSLFTSVPDAIFDVYKANHWAAALRLQTALSPLNVLGSDETE